jgi:glycosyltransferase involved in cell wall biosynthesis
MISTDRGMFDPASAVSKRTLAYSESEKVSGIDVIIFSLRKQKFQMRELSPHLRLYPTNSRSRWFYVRDALKLARLLFARGEEFDLVTTQDPFETGLVGARVAREFAKPLQVQVHTDFLSPYFKRVSLLNRLRVRIATGVLPRASSIRVVSQKIKSSIEREYRPTVPIDVLPVFVDATRFAHLEKDHNYLEEKYPKANIFALIVSRLEKEKNVALAIDIFAQVSNKYPTTALIVVGEGSLRKELERKVIGLGLQERVYFEGWATDPSRYFQSADIFLNTSYYEGFGMTLLEAKLAGLCTVTTDVGITGELAGEGFAVTAVGDRVAFKSALDNFLSQPDLRLTTHINAPTQIEGLLSTQEAYVASYVELWESVLKIGNKTS